MALDGRSRQSRQRRPVDSPRARALVAEFQPDAPNNRRSYWMKVFNLYNDELDNSNEREGWNFRAAKVGEHIGGELIGAGLYEAERGTRSGRITPITPMRSGSSSF